MLSFQGWGQSFSIKTGNEAPLSTCNRVTFNASHPNALVTQVYIWSSLDGSVGSYIKNNTPNLIGDFNAYITGYYKVEYIDDFNVSYGFSSQVYQILIDVLSVGGSISGSTTVCSGSNSSALTLSGITGSVTKWQSSTDAVFTTALDISNTTSSHSANNLTSKLYYRAVVKNGVCATMNSSNVVINVDTNNFIPSINKTFTYEVDYNALFNQEIDSVLTIVSVYSLPSGFSVSSDAKRITGYVNFSDTNTIKLELSDSSTYNIVLKPIFFKKKYTY